MTISDPAFGDCSHVQFNAAPRLMLQNMGAKLSSTQIVEIRLVADQDGPCEAAIQSGYFENFPKVYRTLAWK